MIDGFLGNFFHNNKSVHMMFFYACYLNPRKFFRIRWQSHIDCELQNVKSHQDFISDSKSKPIIYQLFLVRIDHDFYIRLVLFGWHWMTSGGKTLLGFSNGDDTAARSGSEDGSSVVGVNWGMQISNSWCIVLSRLQLRSFTNVFDGIPNIRCDVSTFPSEAVFPDGGMFVVHYL